MRMPTPRHSPPASNAPVILEVNELPMDICHKTTVDVTPAIRPQSEYLSLLYRTLPDYTPSYK